MPWSNVAGGVSKLGGQVTALAAGSPDHLDFRRRHDEQVSSTWGDRASNWAPWFLLGIG